MYMYLRQVSGKEYRTQEPFGSTLMSIAFHFLPSVTKAQCAFSGCQSYSRLSIYNSLTGFFTGFDLTGKVW